MLEVKIDDLPPAGEFGDSDGYEVSQGGVSRRMSGAVIKAEVREIAADEAQKAVEGISGGATINDYTPSTSMCYSSAKVEELRKEGVNGVTFLHDDHDSTYTLQLSDIGGYIRVVRSTPLNIVIPDRWIAPITGDFPIVTVRLVGNARGTGAVTITAQASDDTYEMTEAGVTVQIMKVYPYADIIGPGGVSLSLLQPC